MTSGSPGGRARERRAGAGGGACWGSRIPRRGAFILYRLTGQRLSESTIARLTEAGGGVGGPQEAQQAAGRCHVALATAGGSRLAEKPLV